MSIAITAALTAVWEFLKPVLSDGVKDRLKAEPAAARGKRATFDLYEQLGYVRWDSQDYVDKLREFVEGMANDPTLAEQETLKANLRSTMSRLEDTLQSLPDAIRAVAPQLDVHLPNFTDRATRYEFDRSMTIAQTRRWMELDDLAQVTREELQAVLRNAEGNHQRVVSAIEGFRAFLAETYTYQDSF